MPPFALDDSLSVNIFRTEEHYIDAAGLMGPLWAVREFDMKVLRIHSSRRYPRKVRSGPSEQSIRAAIRQAMLNLRLRIEQAQKHEIRILKDQNVLGKRAPSCTLLNSMDTIRLLKAFGKKRAGAKFKARVSEAYPHLEAILEREWETPIPPHHRAVLEADFGSSDDLDEREGEDGLLANGHAMQVGGDDSDEERRRGSGFRTLPPSRGGRNAGTKPAASAVGIVAEDVEDAEVMGEVDYARNRQRAIAARRRFMKQHAAQQQQQQYAADSATLLSMAQGDASTSATPSPQASPSVRTLARSLSSSPAAASSPAPHPVRAFSFAGVSAPRSGAASVDADDGDDSSAGSDDGEGYEEDAADAEEEETMSANEEEFFASTANPHFAVKLVHLTRFRTPPAVASGGATAPASEAQIALTRRMEEQRLAAQELLQQLEHKRQAEALHQQQQEHQQQVVQLQQQHDLQLHQQMALQQQQHMSMQMAFLQQQMAAQHMHANQAMPQQQQQQQQQIMTQNGHMFVPQQHQQQMHLQQQQQILIQQPQPQLQHPQPILQHPRPQQAFPAGLLSRSPSPSPSSSPALSSPSPTASVAHITSSLDALFSVAAASPDQAAGDEEVVMMVPQHESNSLQLPVQGRKRRGQGSARNSVDMTSRLTPSAYAAADDSRGPSRNGSDDDEYVDASSAAALRKQQRRAQRRVEKTAALKQAHAHGQASSNSSLAIAVEAVAPAIAAFPGVVVPAAAVTLKRAHSSLLSENGSLGGGGLTVASDASVSPDSKKAKTRTIMATVAAAEMAVPVAVAPVSALAVPHAHYSHLSAPVVATVLMASPPSSLPVSRVASAVPTPAGSKSVSPMPICAALPASIPVGMPVLAATVLPVMPAQAVTLASQQQHAVAMSQEVMPSLVSPDPAAALRQLVSPSSSAASAAGVESGASPSSADPLPAHSVRELDSPDSVVVASSGWMVDPTTQAALLRKHPHPPSQEERSESSGSDEAMAMGFAAALARHAHAMSTSSTDATPLVSAAQTPTMASPPSSHAAFEFTSPTPPPQLAQPALPAAMAAAAAAGVLDGKAHAHPSAAGFPTPNMDMLLHMQQQQFMHWQQQQHTEQQQQQQQH